MRQIKLNKTILFWFLNIVYWAFNLYLSVKMIAVVSPFNRTMHYINAFIVSMVLRHFYRKVKLFEKSLFSIIIFIITASFLAGILWFIGSNIVILSYQGKLIRNFSRLFDHIGYDIGRTFYPYLVWSTIYLGYKVYEKFSAQKSNTEKAIALAKNAQLEMLRYQLNPHFLFNTLSSLRALIRNRDNATAENMVTQISEFLKYSLLDKEQDKVPLLKEIKNVKHYFEIEQIRFKDQLIVNYCIDADTENFLLPVFILHPIIENAVKYGMKTSPAPLTISISTKIIDDALHIGISNTGYWFEREDGYDTTGTGIKNTVKRLELAFPQNSHFDIIKEKDLVNIKMIIKRDGTLEDGKKN